MSHYRSGTSSSIQTDQQETGWTEHDRLCIYKPTRKEQQKACMHHMVLQLLHTTVPRLAGCLLSWDPDHIILSTTKSKVCLFGVLLLFHITYWTTERSLQCIQQQHGCNASVVHNTIPCQDRLTHCTLYILHEEKTCMQHTIATPPLPASASINIAAVVFSDFRIQRIKVWGVCKPLEKALKLTIIYWANFLLQTEDGDGWGCCRVFSDYSTAIKKTQHLRAESITERGGERSTANPWRE